MKVTCLVKPISLMLMSVALCIGSASVWAADAAPAKVAPPPTAAPPSKEMREKMAQMHEKMSACLRSDRPVAECHEEMKKACHDAGEHACGMMGERHKMMMHDDHDHAMPAGTPPAKP